MSRSADVTFDLEDCLRKIERIKRRTAALCIINVTQRTNQEKETLMKISHILSAVAVLQVAALAEATDAGFSNDTRSGSWRVPMLSECREIMPDNRIMITRFSAPMNQHGTQNNFRIVRTINLPSLDTDTPVSSGDPTPLPKIVFDITSKVTSIAGQVAYLSPAGFVNYSSLGTGEIVFDLPDEQDIASVASNCVFPEPGVIIGN